MRGLHIAVAVAFRICYIKDIDISFITMTSLKSTQSAYSLSRSASSALENREEFTVWAEAVRQQMLEALQKRQRSS